MGVVPMNTGKTWSAKAAWWAGWCAWCPPWTC